MRQLLALSLFASTSLLSAQQGRLVVPPEYTEVEAPGGTAFGWGQGQTARHVQWIYDSSYFTNNGVDHPILITRLRWRANGANTVVAGTYANATLTLASATVDCLTPTTTFAANLGPDATVVHSGPVSLAAAQGATPNNWFVDLPLQTPFLYDPTLGADLVTDFVVPASSLTGSSPIHDAVFNGSATPPLNILGGRVQATSTTATTGAILSGGLIVLEVGYDYPPGVAYGQSYGNGCYDKYLTWYEQFGAGAFDLQNRSVQMTYAGSLYIVDTGNSPWVAPTSTPLTMGDDTISPPLQLPFTFPYVGGTTSALQVCSNGYILLQPTTATNGQFAPSSAALLAGPARLLPAWTDWNPAAGGTVHFDVAANNQSVIVTWDNVVEYQQTTPNSFQVEIDVVGNVTYRYLGVATASNSLMAAWTQGAPARDPGARDLDTSFPFLAQTDTLGLRLSLSGRPRLGTSCDLVTSFHAPAGPVTFGATVFGVVGFPQGQSLASLGMPGCMQYATLDATQSYLVSQPTSQVTLALPNDPAFAGLHLYAQSLSVAPAANQLGAITSNGIDLLIEVQ